ncbi:MAG: histidine--tRNA ligase [Bradyrhizobiaceae bacterium]|nr:histidine--tRNA ligase [Bradyrhizobiaceae bacterium]
MHQVVRGMRDLFGSELSTWQRVERCLIEVATQFGYEEFRTPIVEHAELFNRGVGENTDIVGKEMYVFTDRGGDVLTLRPEMTAPIVRAAIEHNLVRHKPTTRLWYLGPLFRYERPQKGRYRQFFQFGAELLGSPHPEADAEVIMLGADALQRSGASGITLEINTLGSPASRASYRQRLVEYLQDNLQQLSADSQRRLTTNPLRVLDSKDAGDKTVIAGAPVLTDHLDTESQDHFGAVLALLDSAGIAYTRNALLVRGLDYYSHTVFEFTTSHLGAQNTVCGGGRYDPLFSMLGGSDIPAVGFSIGVDRLLLLIEQMEGGFAPVPSCDVYVCAMTDAARLPAQLVALRLRRAGIAAMTDLQRKSGKAQLKDADRTMATWAILLGQDELDENTVMLKNLRTQEQRAVSLEHLLTEIQRS